MRITTYSALNLIVENPGIRQSELAKALDIERPNTVVILDDLEHPGWIDRRRVETGRRAYALFATLAGQRFATRRLPPISNRKAAFWLGWTHKRKTC